MVGETNLVTLLQSMQPILQDGEFVFCTVAPAQVHTLSVDPIALFQESEGTTLIVRREQAEQAALPFIYPSRLITLSVHSSLEAIGFLAAITTKLAEQGISVNPISAYYHDHLFVPTEQAEAAMNVLMEFSQGNKTA